MDVYAEGFDDKLLCRKLDREWVKQKDHFFEGLFIDVPTPFKVGDIVCSKKTPFGYRIYNDDQPFVLTWMANWTSEMSKERGDKNPAEWQDRLLKNHKETGDATDMTANGYFLATDYSDRYTGEFYGECMHDYTDLEYYRGEFIGGERVLLPISSFIKGEIDEHTFAKACEIIKKQEETKCDIRCLGILDEWVKKLGLE